jgi:hypothetical protein
MPMTWYDEILICFTGQTFFIIVQSCIVGIMLWKHELVITLICKIGLISVKKYKAISIKVVPEQSGKVEYEH